MGRRGPPPRPTRLKLLQGETRPSRIGSPEPQPREHPPEAPTWLAVEARAVWDRTVAELDAMGMAFAADADALAVYCNAVVNHARAQQVLDRSGVLVKGADGGIVRNPANTVVNHNAAVIARFAREFGLTPSARVGLAGEAEPEDSRRLAARLLS
ncbi:MAG: phage terminase small subunit P27 family [Sphingomonadaceae bacterium]|nr:phage terminase small subunit P27 family [Sphingomonadaceae bacterium]MBV9098476.1 phage terminase small subunit P27 family [Frankiaceae bacterium]